MLEVRTNAHWNSDGEALDLGALGRLLAALDETPQVAAAARALGISYRSAWGKLVHAERVLGVRLVDRVKGHGSRPTEAGLALARAHARFERDAARRVHAASAALHAAIGALAGDAPRALRLVASHDLLLQALLTTDALKPFSVRFTGSEQALLALERDEADLAGFHLPEPIPPASGRPAIFRDPRRFVEAIVRREQGLIVARGNPLRIRDVADLARTGLRFVNRQRGAATRAWFDRLLGARGMKPSEIRGYEREEFTHLAVAASVAAGMADAGFGLRAAAAQLDLGFVAVGGERYFLAGARELREHRAVRALVRELRARAGSTPGYTRLASRATRA